MVWHPTKYAELLSQKMHKFGSQAWLVNTGWSGGGYGKGSRLSLKHTRAIIDAINDGSLTKVETVRDSLFGFEIPTACPGVPGEILNPRNTWQDKELYDSTAKKLAELFKNNFKKFETTSSKKISDAGPV